MGVCVENLDGLKRRIRFSIPAERIYAAVQGRLKDLVVRSRIPGFRLGKAPLAVVEQVLGPQVRQDVIEELLLISFKDAAVAENLHPSGPPSFEWVGSDMAASPAGSPEFVAVFEVEPDFVPASVEQIRVERPVTEIDEESISQRLEELRQLHCQWRNVQRPAVRGDRVVVDLYGELDGEPLYKMRRIPIVLGGSVALPAFGRAVQDAFCRDLEGLLPGALADMDIGFPSDHQQVDVAGQCLHFQVRVHEVAVQVLPELNSLFALRVGVPDADPDKLRSWLKRRMEEELQRAIGALIRQQILDALAQLNPIEVPRSHIETLFERRFAQCLMRMNAEGFQAEDMEIASWLIEHEARKQAAIDLIVARIARDQGLTARAAREPVPAAEESERPTGAMFAQPVEKAVTDEVENNVIDWVYQRVQVIETPLSFAELMDLWKRKTA